MKKAYPEERNGRKYRYQRVVVILYACAVAALFLCVIWRGTIRGLLKREGDTGNAHAVNWAEEYPFAENDREMQTEEKRAGEPCFLERYEQRVSKVKASLEWYCTDGFYLQPQCVELSALVNKVLGMKIIQSESRLVSVHGGYITMLTEWIDTRPYAANVAEFAEFLSGEEIPFLYVESLFKADRDDEDPLLYDDHANQNADELVGYLRDAGVSVLDLRDCVVEQDLDHYSLFFRTDTHWLPSTGLWASGQIAERLDEETPYTIPSELLTADRYRSVCYPRSYLGSSGRNAGLSYAGLDDFTLLLPDYETSLTYISKQSGIDRSGSFGEALIEWERLESRAYYANSAYDAYMGGRQPLAKIHNEYADNEIRLLFISDSFGVTVAPFLAMTVREIDFIDPRLFDGSVERYIRENRPDIVIVMYNPEVINAVDPNSNASSYMLR